MKTFSLIQSLDNILNQKIIKNIKLNKMSVAILVITKIASLETQLLFKIWKISNQMGKSNKNKTIYHKILLSFHNVHLMEKINKLNKVHKYMKTNYHYKVINKL